MEDNAILWLCIIVALNRLSIRVGSVSKILKFIEAEKYGTLVGVVLSYFELLLVAFSYF